MSTRTITVASVEQRPVKTRYGDKAVYTLVGTDGGKIDFDFKKPASVGVEIGGTYEVQTEAGKYGLKLVKGTIPTPAGLISGPGLTIMPEPVTAMELGFRPTTFPVDPTDVRNVDIRTAALNAAVRFWENRAIEAKVDEKAQAEDVVKTAYLFADYISGQREVKSLGDLASEADSPM